MQLRSPAMPVPMTIGMPQSQHTKPSDTRLGKAAESCPTVTKPINNNQSTGITVRWSGKKLLLMAKNN